MGTNEGKICIVCQEGYEEDLHILKALDDLYIIIYFLFISIYNYRMSLIDI